MTTSYISLAPCGSRAARRLLGVSAQSVGLLVVAIAAWTMPNLCSGGVVILTAVIFASRTGR